MAGRFVLFGCLLAVVAVLAIDNPSAKQGDDTVSIQPNGAEFGDMGDFGSMFDELLQDPELGGLLGGLMGGLGGGGANAFGSLLGDFANPDTMMKHAEDVLGVNPLELLEKFGDPKMMEEMMSHVSDHELFRHLEEGNFQHVIAKMMDPAYMHKFAEELHSDPKVKAMVDKVTSDPHIQTIVERVSSGESAEKVQGLVQQLPLAQMVAGFGGGAPDLAALLGKLGGGQAPDLMQLMGKLGGEGGVNTLLQQLMQGGGDPSKLLQGDMGKMLGGLLGGAGGAGGLDINSILSALNPPTDTPKQAVPDLHKFASLVDTLGGLDKVVDMMKEMGMEDMLEKAGGVDALKKVIAETHPEQ